MTERIFWNKPYLIPLNVTENFTTFIRRNTQGYGPQNLITNTIYLFSFYSTGILFMIEFRQNC